MAGTRIVEIWQVYLAGTTAFRLGIAMALSAKKIELVTGLSIG